MCGRYASARGRAELADRFEVDVDAADDDLEPDYNVAPTKPVPAVLERPQAPGGSNGAAGSSGVAGAGEDAVDEQAVRQLRTVRWGLVPSWAKDVKIGSRLINARAETVHEKPAFRRAFARRRCLLPADGFYEWYELTGPGGKPRKQPFFIRPRDGGPMAMAGLYELWRSPADEWVWSCTVITTQASDEVGRIHDRMPMIVEPRRWDAWLDPGLTDVEQVRGLLVPAMATSMEAYPVDAAVGNVRNNGPELLRPLAAEPPEALF